MMNSPNFEFHVSRQARERYGFADILFSFNGNVILANLPASRDFAHRMNQVRDVEKHPERTVNPGALNAMGLIDETLHAVMALYRRQRDSKAMLEALAWFEARLGREALQRTLLVFTDQFPPVEVYRGGRSAAQWLADSTAGTPHQAVALEEIIMLWLANANPAFKSFTELFEDAALSAATSYSGLTAALRDYFETRPRFGPEQQNLVDMLRAPALASPDSLAGQLEFIRRKWADLLGDFFQRLLTAIDVIKEEEIAVWMRFHPPGPHFGGGPMFGDSSAAAVPRFAGLGHEYERFSPDTDWMPKTVLIAKTVHVWLHQLSTQYRRNIGTLDQVPEEELQKLARQGFNALWLIGVWERSQASQKIKQLTGNPEAAASAYSLYDYIVAADLGGESAYQNLRKRAWIHGIRLASDMVPNHMGIDSRWVTEHPEWFIALPYSPFPSYTFHGPDLSGDARVELKIEDHYYNRTDAAVVFRRLDRWTADTRYIYHGNDGTSFPWNDTAQLDYLNPEVREAVIQTILRVARQFPIIRFDAAMTLTKKHYQRLWFPQPGTGGAIPSRAERGLTKEQFDAAMPHEFWREVVDRVAAEVPGTLLLAEAFWLLEGYFVRTLGMHRVYNSAFMNMLRDEENANYRSVLKNTLEFDPEVLKRYVNFMNNPDERTAVDQFGKGDKYFGVCTLMATLPGLPMFGHGQVEGYAERYGMEYRRAYHDEEPDSWLVARHEREISPLLHRRALFAEVSEFLLYDFYTANGRVNEDVFAYSNRLGNDRALIVYHNRFADTRGWIRLSSGYAEKTPDGKRIRQRTLGEAFGLGHDPNLYISYRDAFTGLEHLHRASEVAEKGMWLSLGAYKCHVFLDWREQRDDGIRPWGELCHLLAGAGVPSLDEALHALELKPVYDALRGVLDPTLAGRMAVLALELAGQYAGSAVHDRSEKTGQPEIQQFKTSGETSGETDALVNEAEARLRILLDAVQHFVRSGRGSDDGLAPAVQWRGEIAPTVQEFRSRMRAALRLPALEGQFSEPLPKESQAVLPSASAPASQSTAIWATILAWAALEALGRLHDPAAPEAAAAALFDALHLREPIAEAFRLAGWTGDERWQAAARVRAAFAHVPWITGAETISARHFPAPFSWLHDPDLAWLLGVNEYEGVRYYNQESYERLVWWMALGSLLKLAEIPEPDQEAVQALERRLKARLRAAAESQYRVEALFDSGAPQ